MTFLSEFRKVNSLPEFYEPGVKLNERGVIYLGYKNDRR